MEFSRKCVSFKLGIGERQLQRYLLVAAEHLEVFKSFWDKKTRTLLGMPIETEEQIEYLKIVRSLHIKYRHTKNKTEIIAGKLHEINQKEIKCRDSI